MQVIVLPPWLEYVLIGVVIGIPFLIIVGFFMAWAWQKFFHYLGRNERRNPDDDHDALT